MKAKLSLVSENTYRQIFPEDIEGLDQYWHICSASKTFKIPEKKETNLKSI